MLAECMTPSQGVSLYIPLWYDSNQFKGYASMDAATFTFHSGTILIRERALNDREATLLYIPLWYDSNAKMKVIKESYTSFTFHSGTILI